VRILIVGGSGFVGTHLTRFLVQGGHEVTVLSRNPHRGRDPGGRVSFLRADAREQGPWMEAVADHEILINLAGVSIFKRWNEAYKTLLAESRILVTRNLVEAIPAGNSGEKTLISTSAVGYYGFAEDEELTEDAPGGEDFLASLSSDWEAEALKARGKGVRVVLTRFGVVLGNDGGALPKMALPFRFFAGGPVGDGRQWVSWIHIEDLCRAELFLLEHKEIEGPVNFTAPVPVRNRVLAAAIGRSLSRPSVMPAPAFVIGLVLGEFGSVILKGQRVLPRALERAGFTFKFPTADKALDDLFGRDRA
jgi:uncharacterized protein (TIGR01777 family)